MNRLLTFHYHRSAGKEVRMAPSAYYMDAEYDKVAVRIYAEVAPANDAKIDIFDDGVSIFTDNTDRRVSRATGAITVPSGVTAVVLSAGQNSEEYAEDFNDTLIEEGSWVYCTLADSGGGENFSVQLELRQVSEDEEEKD